MFKIVEFFKSLKGRRAATGKALKPSDVLTFSSPECEVTVPSRTTILALAFHHKIKISSSCGGMGSCGTCRVFIENCNLPRRNQIEAEMASERDFAENERLACQTIARAGMKVRLPNEST